MQAAPPDALLRAPAEKWNSLQIIEHLFLSYTATTKGLLRTMEEGQPKQTTPRASLGNEPLRHVNDALVAMDATLADAEKRFGARTRVLNLPILGPLTAQQWRRFHQVHGRHHLKQIAARVSGQE